MKGIKEYKLKLHNQIRRKIRVLADSCDERYKNEVKAIYDLFVESKREITGYKTIVEDSKIKITAQETATEKVDTIKRKIVNLKENIRKKKK